MTCHHMPLSWRGWLGRCWCASVLTFAALLAAPPVPAQVTDQRIEITIRDYRFLKTHSAGLHPGLPATIVLTNEDDVRHGFTSPFFSGLHIEGEGEGVASYGNGIEGFYIDPGKTLTIRFIMPQPGRFTFRCDIHKKEDMEGEIYLLDVPVA